MLIGTILLTIVVPLSIQKTEIVDSLNNTYVVQAVIDSARIIGLPPSEAAKAHAKRIQTPDFATQQIIHSQKRLSVRRLFFKHYFQ